MKYVLAIIVIIMATAVYAADLSDYPDILKDDENIDAYFVVGQKASAVDVISQANIVLAIVGTTGQNMVGVSKLDNEVDDIYEKNIVSIGNPCINKVTAEIMNNPEPCDKDFIEGQAKILLYENSDLVQIIIAGKTQEGTSKAAQTLIENDGLYGKTYLLNFEEVSNNEPDEDNEPEDTPEDEPEETVPQDTPGDASSQGGSIIIEESQPVPELISVEPEIKEQENKPVIEQNIFEKILNWIISLFT